MAIDLPDILQDDTGYVGKFATWKAILDSAVSALQAALGAAPGSVQNLTNTQTALYGDTTAILGASSYLPTIGGNILTISSGDAWIGSPTYTVVGQDTSTPIDFTGLPAGTYYVHVDSFGVPSANTTAADALYSVVWSDPGLSMVTLVARIGWSDQSLIDALSSTRFNKTYTDLDGRIEAGEKAQTVLLSKTVAAANIALTQDETMESAAIRLTGAQTANITLTLFALPKPLFIINDCTGGFTVTVQVGVATATVVTANTSRTHVHSDGANSVY